MMIRRNTWVVLVLLAALIGFAFYLRSNKARQEAAATPTAPTGSSQPLFAAQEGQPSSIKIEDSLGNSVSFERNGAGVWVLKAPTAADADQAAAEAAASQVTSLHVLASVNLGLDIVGLDTPAYVLSASFAGGKSHALKIGAITPVQNGYYTSLDGGPIQIVDKAGLDALIGLLQQPPYAASAEPTLTPTAFPPTSGATGEPTAAPEATGGTPGSAGTPSPTRPASPTATP